MNFFSRRKRESFFESLENEVKEEYLHSDYKTDVKFNTNALTKDEIINNDDDEIFVNINSSVSSPLESLKKRMLTNESPNNKKTHAEISSNVFEDKSVNKTVVPISTDSRSLLEKCKLYTVDENGNDLSDNDEQLYKLESVAEILRSDSEFALKELSKKYNLTFEDSAANINTSIPFTSADTKEENESAFEDSEIQKEDNLQTSQFPIISDIDNNSITSLNTTSNDTEIGSTIRFIPVKDPITNTNTISISSITRKIDIQSELEENSGNDRVSLSETHLESTEFEEFKVAGEYTDQQQSKSILRKLSIKKRNSFLCCAISLICTIISLVFLINPISNLLLTATRSALIFTSVLFFINFAANCDMLLSFKSCVKKECSSDIFSSLSSVATILLIIFAIKSNQSGAYHIIVLSSLILSIRAMCKYFDASALLGNFKKICHTRTKKAVTLINDSATTFVMAKNAVEGDALIATPRKTSFINDFMKYSKFGVKLNGKIPTFAIISTLLAVIVAFSANYYYKTAYDSFYCACVILCISAFPDIFMIDTLPNYFSAIKLNKKGAMIAGKTAAEKLELANAVVLSTSDIFPSGTVTLQSIKVLSSNNIDDTIMRAASLTEAVNSTLAPIFKQIAGTNSSYELPDSDTVKYEDKLGLSGWVADELLFIGNRTLMEAHGIAVPSIELDRKILKKGYFPVYLATGGKACAMIIIQYNVDENVARELKKITELGVTLLITNSDPNINEEMISDYFGIYSDFIKIVSNAGVHMYNNAVIETKNCSAPAAFMGSNINFIAIMNCASRMKKSNALLTIIYVLLSVIGAILFIYASFAGANTLPPSKTILTAELFATLLTFIIFLFKKP